MQRVQGVHYGLVGQAQCGSDLAGRQKLTACVQVLKDRVAAAGRRLPSSMHEAKESDEHSHMLRAANLFDFMECGIEKPGV